MINRDAKLVHGRPYLTREPFCQFGHAWIENDDVCIDASTLLEVPRNVYYAVGRIDSALCFTYTFEQMRRKLLEFKHYGPWEGVDAVPPYTD